MLPVEQTSEANHRLVYQNQERSLKAARGAEWSARRTPSSKTW